jgi:hypothetical protein
LLGFYAKRMEKDGLDFESYPYILTTLKLTKKQEFKKEQKKEDTV